nr:peptidoglycan DD-metalloendopeptidase family protein [Ectothiorhodospira shaposhnikovii]
MALILLLLLSGCAAIKPEDPAFRSGTYTVRQHETLYSIAWRYGLEWQELARWNGIREPYTIYPGQRLRMNPLPGQSRTATAAATTATPPRTTATAPRETPADSPPPRASTPTPAPVPAPSTSASSAPAARPEPTAPASSRPVPTTTPPPAASTPPRPAPVAQPVRDPVTPAPSPAASGGPLVWQWPTNGQVIRRFDAQGTGKKGIAIAGQRGQPVRAAAAGRVVYSGSGLVGYGKLIIIKHNDSYLSAYGHNDNILVNEGARVAAGQQIALLGDSGTDRPMLHFEIRKDGKPVDPLRYMPDR